MLPVNTNIEGKTNIISSDRLTEKQQEVIETFCMDISSEKVEKYDLSEVWRLHEGYSFLESLAKPIDELKYVSDDTSDQNLFWTVIRDLAVAAAVKGTEEIIVLIIKRAKKSVTCSEENLKYREIVYLTEEIYPVIYIFNYSLIPVSYIQFTYNGYTFGSAIQLGLKIKKRFVSF